MRRLQTSDSSSQQELPAKETFPTLPAGRISHQTKHSQVPPANDPMSAVSKIFSKGIMDSVQQVDKRKGEKGNVKEMNTGPNQVSKLGNGTWMTQVSPTVTSHLDSRGRPHAKERTFSFSSLKLHP